MPYLNEASMNLMTRREAETASNTFADREVGGGWPDVRD